MIPTHGKKIGKLVKQDYIDAAKKYCLKTGIKYKADTIIKSFGLRCIRLPPYHPELNPIGERFFFGSSNFFGKLILCFLAVWHFVSLIF